jgi:hypothetical protein
MAEENPERDYVSATQAVAIIDRPFRGDSRQLQDFVEKAEAALEIVHPKECEILLKLISTKIQGEAKRLLTKVDRNTWLQIKDILEEHYSTETVGCDTENWDDVGQEFGETVHREVRLSQLEIEVAALKRGLQELEARKDSYQGKEESKLIDKVIADLGIKRLR